MSHRRRSTNPFSSGPALPDDFEFDPNARRAGPPPPAAYPDNADPYPRHHASQHANRDRYSSPPPAGHSSHRHRAPSPALRDLSPPAHRRSRAYSPPPRAYSPPRHSAYSPPPRANSPPPRRPRARSSGPRGYSPSSPPPSSRRYEPEPEPRRQPPREDRGRRARSPDGREARRARSRPEHRDEPDGHRASRSHPPPRYQSPPPRYPPPSSSRQPTHSGRHHSVPPVRPSIGAGGRRRSSSVGNQMWSKAAQTALKAGAAAAFKARNDPSPWLGEKGGKVATAALGAALVDTFLNQRHPKTVGGVRHHAMRQVAEAALGRAVVNPAMHQARRHH